MAITPETRDYRTFEVRALDTGEEDKQYRVEGYAAVFDEETVLYEYDGIEYKEVIDRSAFTGAEMRDVVMNYNHDDPYPYGELSIDGKQTKFDLNMRLLYSGGKQ